ncbi:MAG: 3-dehydroquinate synthase [Clostridiales bacterium]|nr:3-dehydroquinate synthase [Clostridiales bacterium]
MNEILFVKTAEEAGDALPQTDVLYVTDENVYALYKTFFPQNTCVLPSGEDQKTLRGLEVICNALVTARVDRQGAVVVVGGGVMGDLAGFASATYMRGISLYMVPTTLLSQVDSAIGGKTAVDLGNLKNIIGAFKMPQKIVICPAFLQTLPAREWRCGLGELLKTALLDKEIYAFVSLHIKEIVAREASAVGEAVRLCATFKKGVTDCDPTEKGERKILNLGHTVGHALEACDRHKQSHGEYVLSGLYTEACMTDAPKDTKQKITALLKEVQPLTFDFGGESITRTALSDKKNAGGKISVLRLKNIGEVEEVLFEPLEFAAKYEAAKREEKII